jgi:type I restriction enzyme S subunit
MSVPPKFSHARIISLAAADKWSLNGGPFGSKLVSKMYVEVGVPVIRGANLPFEQRFSDEGFVFVTHDKASELKAHTAKPGDIIFTQRGTLGQVGIIPATAKHPLYVISQSQMKLTVNPIKADPFFIYYVFKTPSIVGSFIGLASTSGVPHVNLQTLRDFEVPLPPLETQRRIASILGAYDDLIEVNRRRVAVLEEMARGLFEEWFVRFRFPGHETVPILDTPDGPLPEGWRWGPASDLIEFDPRTRVPSEGKKPFISMGLLDTQTSLIGEPEEREGNSGAKFRNGDTLFARITPCLENGKTGLVRNLASLDGTGFGSTEFIVMRAQNAGSAYTYCLARFEAFRSNARGSMTGASGRQRAKTVSVAAFPVAIPPSNNLLTDFERVAWPMLELVGSLGGTVDRLAASRDLLLHRLISGQLSVASAERELEKVA